MKKADLIVAIENTPYLPQVVQVGTEYPVSVSFHNALGPTATHVVYTPPNTPGFVQEFGCPEEPFEAPAGWVCEVRGKYTPPAGTTGDVEITYQMTYAEGGPLVKTLKTRVRGTAEIRAEINGDGLPPT